MKRPFEVDANEYPFKDQWLQYENGCIHYVDEGEGRPVLLLHGNPTWSYLYRNVIKSLSSEFRLIAPDYPGFGMSTAPTVYRFTPEEQAKAVAYFIDKLQLKNFILVIQDWGGPIGMNYAVGNAHNIRAIVVMNSWAWPASLPQTLFSLVMGGNPLGFYLQTQKNFFATKIISQGIFKKENLTDDLKEAYTKPFPTPEKRIPTWVFPRHIRKSRRWLADIESKLNLLSHVPTKILWGKHDEPGFRPTERMRWEKHLKNSIVEILDDASHYVQEDRPDRIIEAIRSFKFI